MSPKEFWSGPPRLARVYREAEVLRARRANAEAWRMGIYMTSALNATVGSMFRKKGSQPIPYLKEPLPLTEQEVKDREIRDAKAREQRIIDLMDRLASAGSVSAKK